MNIIPLVGSIFQLLIAYLFHIVGQIQIKAFRNLGHNVVNPFSLAKNIFLVNNNGAEGKHKAQRRL